MSVSAETTVQPGKSPGFDQAEHDLMRAWKSVDAVRYDIVRVERWDEYEIREAQALVEKAVRALRDLKSKVKLIEPVPTK